MPHAHSSNDTCDDDEQVDEETTNSNKHVSNEYVLNVAFLSFVCFCACQFVFAVMARSQAMMADTQAMGVDAMTYLFNMCAERYKPKRRRVERDEHESDASSSNRQLEEEESSSLSGENDNDRNLRRLYLELFPPMVSVVCLIFVTISTLQEASESLWGDEKRDAEEVVSLPIMLVFSAMNLLLDIVNVTCFARANMNFGLDVVRREASDIHKTVRRRFSKDYSAEAALTESSSLLPTSTNAVASLTRDHCETESIVNLNMCSAWTHVCADTLRSAAVLIAAGIAFVFPIIKPESADSVAAIIVSAIIFVSLVPLIQGLCLTAMEIYRIKTGGSSMFTRSYSL